LFGVKLKSCFDAVRTVVDPTTDLWGIQIGFFLVSRSISKICSISKRINVGFW
jgi:hypothetical protein